MSQASKVLKEIAAGAEYTALVQAMEKNEYEAIAGAYKSLINVIEEKKKAILDKIDTLTRQNKEDDRQQFLKTFSIRAGTTLPQLNHINNLLQLQKVTVGEVVGVGSKGDPMVRTPDGKLTIISMSGASLEKGSKVTFRITKEGEQVNFGQVMEFNGEFFYFLLNQTMLNAIRDRFTVIEERFRTCGEMTPALLGELLGEVEKVRDLITGLRPEEKERVAARILAFRKRLLGEYGVKMAMDFIEKQEADEITAVCEADAEKLACAMAAPGLFRYQTYQVVKNELFEGRDLKGYTETVKQLEGSLETMDSAMKLMEFQSGFEKIEPAARNYLDKIDELFERLNRKARNVAAAMAEDKVGTTNDIQNRIEAAFGGQGACAEIRGVFRSPAEFNALREALTKLRTMLGNTESQVSEAAIHPYITEKVRQAFGR
jgi:hypothetical protein